jgi:beta-lactamase class D
MRYSIAALFMLMFCFQGQAMEWREDATLAAAFSNAGVRNGTFVLYDVANATFTGFNRTRVETRYIPASTFKIPNSLIGLTVGAVADVDDVLPSGGRPQWMKEWERDMSLREAIKISNVPIYQGLARRIGLEKMREYLGKLNYGNADPGTVVDRFWLDGPLVINAVEQTRFLARLVQDELPLPKDVQAAVRDIVRLEHSEGWELFGKTGAAMKDSPAIGWWVGWVQKGDRAYTFAINIDMDDSSEFGKRVEVGKACLKRLGIL